MEPELVRTELATELPAQQAILAGQDTRRPVNQEPVIQLPPSPVHREQVEPEWLSEVQPEPEKQNGHQAETELQLHATRQDRPLASGSSSQPSVQAQQQGIDSQWLWWIGEQIVGVVQYIEAEEKAQMDRLLVTTDELETTRSRIRRLEQDLEMATEELAKMAL